MAKVPSLIDFYNNQNQLAVQAASQTAQNKTQANITSANIGADAKRQQQEMQIEHFRQLMENMRQNRSITSQEGLATAELLARTGQAELGRKFEGSQNASRQKFDKELAQFAQTGEDSRLTKSIASNEAIAAAKINADQPVNAAQAGLIQAQTKAISQPDIEGNISLLTSIATNRKEMAKILGGDKQVSALAETIAGRLRSNGIEPNNIPSVVETQASDVKSRVAALDKNVAQDFETMKKRGAVQYLQQAQVELQSLISQGLIRDPRAAIAKLKAKQKALGVSDDEL